jgi:hypothetical protein
VSDAPRARPAGRPGWIVGVVAFAALAYILLNTLRTEGVGSTGPKVGEPLPPFAAPLATSRVVGDVNVARRAHQGAAGRRPACEVRGTGIVNSCDLVRRGPLAVTFFFTRGADCLRDLDALDRALRAHPRVHGVAVSVRVGRDEARRIVRAHRWSFPVAYDRDGILANLYGVAVCPQLTYALPGGAVQATSIGALDARALDARLSALERAARAKGWRPSPSTLRQGAKPRRGGTPWA